MDEDQNEQLTVAELTVWIEKRQGEQVVLKKYENSNKCKEL